MNNIDIYSVLKDRIVFLAYEPGLVLKEKPLMDEFSVSRTPVREAFIRLEVEGLVRIVPSMGTFVSEVSFQKLKDVFETRSFLIRRAGRLAANRISEKEMEKMWIMIEKMREESNPLALLRIDSELHELINDAAKNEVLSNMLSLLRNQTIRIWSFSDSEFEYFTELPDEFEQIASALASKDGDEAAELLENHTKRFMEYMKRKLMGGDII